MYRGVAAVRIHTRPMLLSLLQLQLQLQLQFHKERKFFYSKASALKKQTKNFLKYLFKEGELDIL